TTLVAVLSLALARCGGDTGPTGWIPRDGTVRGVITASEAFSPGVSPVAAARLAHAVVGARVPALARPKLASRPRWRATPASQPAATANELIVTFRHTALGAPRPGSAALATTAGARAWARAIRSHLATTVPAGAAVVGVSPPILAAAGYDFVSSADSVPLCSGGLLSNAADGDGPDPDPTIPASYSLDSTRTCFAPDSLGAHGLHVAGTIGAVGNDGIGVTGVNW